jgi:ATP-dependent Clp protease protease subunit
MKKWYSIKAKAQDAEIWIYEEIGNFWGEGVSAKSFAEDLKALGKVNNIFLHLNSPGGIVWDGIAIYNLLKQHQARVNVSIEGLAASIASVVAMAGDEITMAENAMMMIHNPWGLTIGNAGDHRAAADMLDKIGDSIILAYLDKQKKTMPDEGMDPQKKKMAGLMDAETWMSAQEAMDHGLIDKITQSLDMAASFDLSKFKYRHIPENFKPANMDIRQKLAQQNSACQRITAASGLRRTGASA